MIETLIENQIAKLFNIIQKSEFETQLSNLPRQFMQLEISIFNASHVILSGKVWNNHKIQRKKEKNIYNEVCNLLHKVENQDDCF